jgi:type 2 lantibiotic biosynthesis protein LanM
MGLMDTREEKDELRIAPLVEKAAALYERIGSRFVPELNEPNLGLNRLKQWRRHVCPDKDLVERLRFDSLDTDRAQALASGVHLVDKTDLPEWAALLKIVVKNASQIAVLALTEVEATCSYLRPNDPIAFEHILRIWVDYASSTIQASHRQVLDLVLPGVFDSLRRQLLRVLCQCAGETLFVEFSLWQTKLANRNSSTKEGVELGVSRECYQRFVHYLGDRGLEVMMVRYPVLARMLCSRTLSWVETTAEFLDRLAADLPELNAMIGTDSPLNRVSTISDQLSDPHNNGRCVFKLEFESGKNIIYKPRSLAPDKAYFSLLDWCNQHGLTTPLRCLRGLYRDGYGWMEFISSSECSTDDEVKRYYRRSGMLICLMYILGGNDFHEDNVIAAGEHPFIVDLETLLYPDISPIDSKPHLGTLSRAMNTFYTDSVFRTNLLPRWARGVSEDRSSNASGITNDGGGNSTVERRTWKSINTDQMQLTRMSKPKAIRHNVVKLGNMPIPAEVHFTSVIDGFREMYQLLIDGREDLVASDGVILGFRELYFRVVFRNTRVYGGILQDAVRPQYLRDGMDISIRIDVLSRPLLFDTLKPSLWKIVAHEHAALFRGDIPLFQIRGDCCDLDLAPSERVEGFCAESGFDSVLRRLKNMGPGDLDLQVSYIRSSLQTRQMAPWISSQNAIDSDEGSFAPTELVEEAVSIARAIQKAALIGNEGTVGWFTRAYDPDAHRWQIQLMDYQLYDGLCGTGVFLAAVEHVTGGAGFRDLATAAFRSAVGAVSLPSMSMKGDIGGGIGIGSLMYGLASGASLLGDESLLERAAEVASLITPQRICDSHSADALVGVAGCLLSLLALYRRNPSCSYVLQNACECGNRLLDLRMESSSGLRSWRSTGGKMHTGLAHGAGGIGYALAQLYRNTGDLKFLNAARESFAFEDSLYQEQAGGWLDDDSTDSREAAVITNRWCHGAAGIGLARFAASNGLSDYDTDSAIDPSIQAVLNEPIGPIDHPCCGNLGRIELLIEVAKRSRRPDLHEKAERITSAVIRRARANLSYGLGVDASLYVPSFHQGMAGIGYQILRLSCPGKLPSVLLWE